MVVMVQQHTRQQRTTYQRQIGRKVLRADHLQHSLQRTHTPTRRPAWAARLLQPKLAAGIIVSIGLIVIASSFGLQLYGAQAAKAEQAAEQIRQEKAVADSKIAEACRRQKVKEKADQIGTITYEQLYDGACE